MSIYRRLHKLVNHNIAMVKIVLILKIFSFSNHLSIYFNKGYLGSPLFINKEVNGIQKWFAVGHSVNDSICGIRYIQTLIFRHYLYCSKYYFYIFKCLYKFFPLC